MMEVKAMRDRMNLAPERLSAEEYNVLTPRLSLVKNWVADAETYILNQKLDPGIFSPLWGEDTMRLIAGALSAGNQSVIECIRLLWWFSGWPIVNYTDANTFPLFDPVYIRYQKLKAVTPSRFQYAAPPILGEAGWIEGNGIVNHDVAILQERMQFLYFAGVTDFLDKTKQGMILEIGSGYGGMSLAFHKSFPEYRNVLCDVPQCLAVAYCYLNAAVPDAHHYSITVDGIYHANTGKKVTAEEAFNTPGAFIYLPNYLMPAYESYLQPTMVYNAMSLHEMPVNTIQYYCTTIPKLLAKQSGVFCEFNTLVGVPNAAIDKRLADSYNHCLEVDYPNLACRPRIWTDSSTTFSDISSCYQASNKAYSLFDLFEFDCINESPVVSDADIKDLLLAKLGKNISPLAFAGKSQHQIEGYSVQVFVVPPGDEPFMGNHLRYIVGRRVPNKPVDLQDKIIELTKQIVRLEETMVQNMREIEEKDREIQNFYDSRSWRYTAFFRKILDACRALKLGLVG